MQIATISEIKNALKSLDAKAISELCLELARYSKENKELLTFLIFEKEDEPLYIKESIAEMDAQFVNINTKAGFFAKKQVRSLLKLAQRRIKISRSKKVEVELIIHFCSLLQKLPDNVYYYPVIFNIFKRQFEKVKKTIDTLHEDLQYDYNLMLEDSLKTHKH
ncbi:MAG: hypothetical protein ACLFQS_03655 [Bacteroidales bacterium]